MEMWNKLIKKKKKNLEDKRKEHNLVETKHKNKMRLSKTHTKIVKYQEMQVLSVGWGRDGIGKQEISITLENNDKGWVRMAFDIEEMERIIKTAESYINEHKNK